MGVARTFIHLWVFDKPLVFSIWVFNEPLRVTSMVSGQLSSQSVISDISGHWSLITGHWSQVTGHLLFVQWSFRRSMVFPCTVC